MKPGPHLRAIIESFSDVLVFAVICVLLSPIWTVLYVALYLGYLLKDTKKQTVRVHRDDVKHSTRGFKQ